MLKINNNTKIRSFDYSYSDFNNRLISIYFNTRNTVISSPKILIALAGLNGAMTENEWLNWSSKLLSIPQSKSQHILDEFREWGILHSIDNHPYSNKQINHSAFKEKNKTQPILICDINPVTEYIVCFLQMFGFENISFLNDMTIDEELVNNFFLAGYWKVIYENSQFPIGQQFGSNKPQNRRNTNSYRSQKQLFRQRYAYFFISPLFQYEKIWRMSSF